MSADGLRLCSSGVDKALKLYDVLTFDLSYMIDVDYVPTAACWIHKSSEPHGRVAVADADSPAIRIYRTDGKTEAVHTLSLHTAPVRQATRTSPKKKRVDVVSIPGLTWHVCF